MNLLNLIHILLLVAFVAPTLAFANPWSVRKSLLQTRGGNTLHPPITIYADQSKGPADFIDATPIGGYEDTFSDRPSAKKRSVPWWSITRLFNATDSFVASCLALLVTDPDILSLLSKVLSSAFWVFFALSILGTVGFDTKPLLSLLSVAGITIGFAAKDLMANTFSGILLLFTRPFERDMIINVGGNRGRVLSMDIRFLKLEGVQDKSIILIPVSKVYGNTIVIEHQHK